MSAKLIAEVVSSPLRFADPVAIEVLKELRARAVTYEIFDELKQQIQQSPWISREASREATRALSKAEQVMDWPL